MRRRCDQGLDAPVVISAIKTLAKPLQDMESALETRSSPVRRTAWRTGAPYVNRLFDLGLLGLWAVDAPNVFRWFSDHERANFAPAISVYLTDADRALFANVDPETPGRVKDILDWD